MTSKAALLTLLTLWGVGAAVPHGLVDYLGIGPLYPTATKSDAAPATGLAAFAELVAASRLPVVTA